MSAWINLLANVLAIIAAPLIALEVGRRLNVRRREYDQQMQVFRTLMATRAPYVSAVHVEALNMIDVAFRPSTPRQKAVALAWKEYLNHLNQIPPYDRAWVDKKEELLAELLHK